MRRFIKGLFLFSLPFIGLIVWYTIVDPFMVVRNYKDYFPDVSRQECSNDAFRGIKLMNLYKDSLHYNSFIVGSSRSDFYYIEKWKEFLDSSAVCFHFNQSGDNLFGMFQRVEYLYNHFEHIDNLLLIMDHELLAGTTPNKGPLFINPYQVTPSLDYFSFHWCFFRTFYSTKFQIDYWNKELKQKDYYYSPSSNELHKFRAEGEIMSNPEEYYRSLPEDYSLYKRDTVQRTGAQVIQKKQKDLLEGIHRLISDGGTDCKVIISPLYDQLKLNPIDSLYLSELFSEKCYFDFSGINGFTQDTLNYYENSHYRPSLSNRLLEIVYH